MTAAARLQAFLCQMECMKGRLSLSLTLSRRGQMSMLKNGLEQSQTHWMLPASADRIAASDCLPVPLSVQ